VEAKPRKTRSKRRASKKGSRKRVEDTPVANVETKQKDVDHKDVLAALWYMGDISYLLHEGQEEARGLFNKSSARIYVMNMSRRWGKSWLACVLAVEAALKRETTQIRYACPTHKMAKNIIRPHLNQIFQDAPADLKPTFKTQQNMWLFPNGSEIHVAGCDSGGAERLRGVSTDLGIVDEAGFVNDDLENVVHDILLPQTLTTNGSILLVSTPPRTPAHPFFNYCQRAEATNAYLKRTIYDAPHISPAMISEYCRESGGVNNTTWRREYLAEFCTDEESSVIPEFTKNEDHLIGEVIRPDFFDCYVSLDLGFSDLSFAVFAYFDFKLGKIVVEDEMVASRCTSDEINAKVMAKQTALWGDKQPLARVVDAPAITIADMSRNGEQWSMTRRDDKAAAVNNLRLAMANHQIIIHPRCRSLISHLKYAIWNSTKTSYARSADHGHFDGVDAMVYLSRAVNVHKNPYPDPRAGITGENHFIGNGFQRDSKSKTLLKLVKPRRGR
tara:strand:- start:1934 stop:3433 length:1500 start_codon:yes stop_codon:yes gene_type:complete